LAYLGESAIETAPDILMDMLLEGDDFVWWKSAMGNYGANLIPGLGEGKKVYKAARILEKFGPKVAMYLTKYGDNALKYIEKNGVDSFADILKKTDVRWDKHGYKHVAQKNMSWKDIIKSTKNGEARYMMGTNIESLERKVWGEGMLVTNGNTWKVMEFDNAIGACSGMETRFMRVEFSSGTIHGHPITEAEYKSLIK
jgi:hypothetical protein